MRACFTASSGSTDNVRLQQSTSQRLDSEVAIACCRGLFIFRGQNIPPMMLEECYDVDLYNWQKVDVTNEVLPSLYQSSFAPVCSYDSWSVL